MLTSPCCIQAGILAPTNNMTNTTQKTALRTMTVCHRFDKLPPLIYPITPYILAHLLTGEDILAVLIGEISHNEDASNVLPVLAGSQQAAMVPGQVAH
jgi:hypothetical protein